MRKLLIVCVWLVCSCACFGQAQAIEELSLNLEKLAQMKMMLNNMYSGYANLVNGYGKIIGVSKSNFDLHDDFLNQLFEVHAPVRNDPRIETVLSNYLLIGMESGKAYSAFVKSMLFTSSELIGIQNSLNVLKSAGNSKLDELQKVLTPGMLRMSDAERISAIDRIDHDVGVLLEQERKLVSEKQALLAARADRKKRIEVLKVLNGIK
ncbi:MAG: hypothetical protein V4557_12860 [Bacteroidota bacterium]